jgi:hypothetical protein
MNKLKQFIKKKQMKISNYGIKVTTINSCIQVFTIKVKFDFFVALFEVEGGGFFISDLVFLDDGVGDLMEIFFVEFFEFGSEDFGEDVVDLNEMAEFDHTIGFVEDEILELFEVED